MWNDVSLSIIAILASLIAGVGGFIVAIFTNNNLRIAVVNSLINKVRGKTYVTLSDLQNHETILKLKHYISIPQYFGENIITDENRLTLYREYMQVVCEVFLESMNNVIKLDFINLDEAQLKVALIEELAWRRSQYNERFFNKLLTINPDKNAATVVIKKIEKWRIYECEIITSNALNVVNSGRFTNVEYKLDTIFHQYALGVDLLCKNGAESFIKLNGELTAYFKSE
jgi:hypothetical protein